MKIRFYADNGTFIDKCQTKEDELVCLGAPGMICVLNDMVYKVLEVIPKTIMTEPEIKEEFIGVVVKLIG